MRDYRAETEKRVDFIRAVLDDSGAQGVVYGNSGGKDSALVGILCKAACENTIGIIMPCGSKINYNEDVEDANAVAVQYGIETRYIDLLGVSDEIKQSMSSVVALTKQAMQNIAPRLRMTVLYAVAASEGLLVAGTGNRSEVHMGYFTKWGDGAYDFNPIADLTVTEIREFLSYLGAPRRIIEKAPSAGLFEGQTDEGEMGVTYKSIDDYLLNGECDPGELAKISRLHTASEHKRNLPAKYE